MNIEISEASLQYAALLKAYLVNNDEVYLEKITQLGKELLSQDYKLEDLGEIHAKAIQKIGLEMPNMSLSVVSEALMTPFLELLIIYSLSLQEQMNRRETAEKNVNDLSKKMQLILEAAADSIIGLSLDGNIIFANPAASSLFGCPEKALCKNHYSILFRRSNREKELTVEKTSQLINETLTHGVRTSALDAFIYNQNNLNIPVSFICTPIYEDEKISGAVILFRDLRDLSQELIRYAEQLRISNDELQNFAYIASHDLQEPLRAINGYTQLLISRYGDLLSEQDAKDFIDFILSGTETMKEMINDLLTYSRITSRGNEFTKVNMSNVMKKCLSNLSVLINSTEAEISYDTLPDVHGDEVQLIQLMQNLLANAMKYMPSDRKPKIHISCEKTNDKWSFSVSDNGIGIPKEYYDKIFVIFQRLHNRSQYSGSGLGLAICKKVVERHHGQIWVSSKVGEGSTFHFILLEA